MKNKIAGKWQYVCRKINTPTGWEQLENCPDNHFIWNFQPDGRLIEITSSELSSATEYYIYPNESFLGIDRSDYAEDGFILVCIEDHYRVEFPSDRCMILYYIEYEEVEPDDFTFKMEMKKL